MRCTRLVLLALLASACRARSAQPLIVTDLAGHRHRVPEPKQKATVLIFIAHDCPISNQYAPELKRIWSTYTPRQVALYLVYAEPDLTPDQARQHAKDYGYQCPVVLDTKYQLVKRTGATVTPEAVVLSPSGKLLYHGRIDDRYVAYGKQRQQATTHDLRRALDAILQHKPVTPAATRAIGCYIPAP